MEEQKFNGWANYETWVVYRSISDSPNGREVARSNTKRVYDAETDPSQRVRTLSEEIEVWVNQTSRVGMAAHGLGADLLAYALSKVEWKEIAETYIEELEEERERGES